MDTQVATISHADLDRARADEATAVQNGFTLQAPIYPIGTPVDPVGVQNYRRSRQAFESMQLAGDVIAQAVAKIGAEQREDVSFPLHRLRLEEDGRVIGMGDLIPTSLRAGLPTNSHAFTQLVTRSGAPGGAASYLTACPPSLRATNLNHWLPAARTPGGKEIEAVLRTRAGKTGREIFACVSERYRRLDVDDLCRLLMGKVRDGARGEALYDGSRFQLTIQFHSDIRPEGAVAGEIFRAAVIIETADDGSRALHVRSAVVRNLCKNLIILDTATQETWAAHHHRDLGQVVSGMIDKALGSVDTFAEQWTEATRDRLLSGIHDQEPAHVFGELIAQGLIHASGVTRDELVDRLVTAWRMEPGCSRSNVINAITRAAHTESWQSPWTTTDLEQQAGQLLYQKVVIAPYVAA